MNLRKLSLTKETIFADTGRPISTPITRAVAVAIVDNPFADRFVDDLSPLFADGAELGQRVMPDLASLLSRSAVAYGKAAIVGLAGEIEHGAAMIHPSLGQPMREAVGGGEAITADALYGIKITYGSYLLLHFPILGALKTLLLIEISYRLFPEPQRLNAVPTQPAAHMSRDERVVAVVLSISLVLFITDVVHGISPAWVSLGAAVACLLPGIGPLPPKILSEVNFGTLVYVAGILSLGAVIAHTGLGTALSSKLLGLSGITPGHEVINLAIITAIFAVIALFTTVVSLP